MRNEIFIRIELARELVRTFYSLSDSVYAFRRYSLLGYSHDSLSRAHVMSDTLNLAGHVQVRWSAHEYSKEAGFSYKMRSTFIITLLRHWSLIVSEM